MKYSFSNPPALTSTAHFTFQPRVTRIPWRPIFTWHPHKARLTSYTCKDTQLKTSGVKHRILILPFQSSHTNHTIAIDTVKVTAAKLHPDPFEEKLPLNPDAPGSPIGPVGPTSPLVPRKPRTPGKPGLPVSPWSEAGPGGPRGPGGPGRPRTTGVISTICSQGKVNTGATPSTSF